MYKRQQYDNLKASYDEVNKKLSTVQTELEGANASVKNLTADLDKAKASLATYQEAEKAAQVQKVNDLVEKAINDCKIDKADKETWVKMAENDFALAESVLAKIPARADLNNEIAKGTTEQAKDGLKDTEAEIKAKVEEVVGKDFKFRKFE